MTFIRQLASFEFERLTCGKEGNLWHFSDYSGNPCIHRHFTGSTLTCVNRQRAPIWQTISGCT
jgi:hypothetical protein